MELFKLLVLASEVGIRDEIARLFEGFSISIDYAEDHIQAVSYLSKTPYRGMVVEDGLLGVSGVEFSRRVKGKLKNLRIMLLVGEKAQRKFFGNKAFEGIDDIIVYPWKREEAQKLFRTLFPAPVLAKEIRLEEDRYVLNEEDQEKLDPDVVKVIIKGIEELPPLPDVVQKILHIVNDEGAGAKDLARIINSEPSLTAKILKITNSSFYGLKQQVTTISHAVVILGFNEVKNLVLGYSIFSNLLNMKGEERRASLEFWRHNMACGVAARVLGEQIGYKNMEELFVVGLLHDIGKTVFFDYFTDRYRDVVRQALEKRKAHYQEEKEVLGLTHADVGFWLAKHWNLPVIIRDGIRFHHQPELARKSMDPYTPTLASVISYADCLSKLLEIGEGGDPFVLNVLPPKTLSSIEPRRLAALGEEIASQVKVFEQSLGIYSEQIWKEKSVESLMKRRLFVIDDTEGMSPLEVLLNVRGVTCKRLPLSKDVFLDMLSSANDILLLHLREDDFYPKFIERLHRENSDPPPVVAFTREPRLSNRGRGVYYLRKPYHIQELWKLLRSIAEDATA